MKIKPQHYSILKTKMGGVINDEVKTRYTEAGKSKTRFAWDVLYSSVPIDFICKDLYEYLDDSHIETAILKIVGRY